MLYHAAHPGNQSGDQCGRQAARDDAHSALQWRTRVRVDDTYAWAHSLRQANSCRVGSPSAQSIHLGTPRAHDASIASITASYETYAHWATTNSDTSTFPPLTRRGSGPSVQFCTPGKPSLSVQVRAFSASGCAVDNSQQPTATTKRQRGCLFTACAIRAAANHSASGEVFLVVLTFSTKRLSRPVHGM